LNFPAKVERNGSLPTAASEVIHWWRIGVVVHSRWVVALVAVVGVGAGF
jgi:hypothetical protein